MNRQTLKRIYYQLNVSSKGWSKLEKCKVIPYLANGDLPEEYTIKLMDELFPNWRGKYRLYTWDDIYHHQFANMKSRGNCFGKVLCPQTLKNYGGR